jgi:hypothetical protein
LIDQDQPQPDNKDLQWEYFVRDSFGHEIVYEVCEYCQEKRAVQQWEYPEEDWDRVKSMWSSYPFQIKNLMKEVEIHGKKRWVCVPCLKELEQE